ncbi:MAG: glycosyltransferase family 2 protein [Anaerolineae bacterium]|nr:glycosyltransferase family 2 protein [Anaerolineae bacterium]
MSPLISVIIPVYNGSRYLDAALASVQAQTHSPLDMIVVNDGSTDGSAAIAAAYPAVRLVSQPNQGTAAARNHGVNLARGDYLAFLDQDDVWVADKLERQMAAFQARPELDMVFGQVQQFFSPDWEAAARSGLYCPPQPVTGYLPSALLVRRSSCLAVGPFETGWRVGEWANWFVRACDLGLTAWVVPHVVAWRRLHAGNKGLLDHAARVEYPRLLKAALDQRRLRLKVSS